MVCSNPSLYSYAVPGTWLHPAHDWRAGHVIFPHTPPDGVPGEPLWPRGGHGRGNPKAQCHDCLPGEKGYFNAAALQASAGPL